MLIKFWDITPILQIKIEKQRKSGAYYLLTYLKTGKIIIIKEA
jgi:hypothetical protein